MPDFMKEFYNKCNGDGKRAMEDLANEYEHVRREFFETTYNHKRAFQKDWNKLTGENKVLTPEEAIAPFNHEYTERAKALLKDNAQAPTNQGKHNPDKQTHAHKGNIGSEAHGELSPARQKFLDNLKSIRAKSEKPNQVPRT